MYIYVRSCVNFIEIVKLCPYIWRCQAECQHRQKSEKTRRNMETPSSDKCVVMLPGPDKLSCDDLVSFSGLLQKRSVLDPKAYEVFLSVDFCKVAGELMFVLELDLVLLGSVLLELE